MTGWKRTIGDLDDARRRPHLRDRAPQLIISPDNGTTHVDTVDLGGKRVKRTIVPSPGELRGVPVTEHGGAIPGTRPERAIDRLDRNRAA